MATQEQVSTKPTFSRRALFQIASAAALGSVVPDVGQSSSLFGSDKLGTTRWLRVRSVVELKGEVRLRDEKAVMKGATKTAPVESTSTLDYEEEAIVTTANSSGPCAYRNILEAKTDCRINKQPIKIALRPECRNIVQWIDNANLWLNSPDQPLTPNERDLIRGTIASAFLDEMLPKSAIRIGDSWELSTESSCRIFQLDSVLSSTVKISLVEADEEKAQLEIEGKLEGVASDVPTELVLRGKIQADRKKGIVTWVAMNIEEKREIGDAKPGFSVEARIRLLRAPIDSPTANETLSSISRRYENVEMLKVLQFASNHGGFDFLAESDWSILQENPDQMVLRLVRSNTTIAQCNIKRLPNLEAGRQMTLEGYQEMVSRSLAESFKQFVEGAESITENKLRLIRTVAVGEAQGVPIQWINCMLSDDLGRRVTMTFTMDQTMSDRFANADVPLVGAFQLKEVQAPASSESDPLKVGSQKAGTTR